MNNGNHIWRDDNDDSSDNDLSNLVPPLARLLGWIAEGENVNQMGMRIAAVLHEFRPDLLNGRSLTQISTNTRQNLDKLVVDFRATFAIRKSSRQLCKK